MQQGGPLAKVPAVSGPDLFTVTAPLRIGWTWPGPQPLQWAITVATSPHGKPIATIFLPGSVFADSSAEFGGNYIYVQGHGSGGVTTTERSNLLHQPT